MRISHCIGALAAVTGCAVLAVPPAADAAVAITVPAAANLGTVPSGSNTVSANLGPVTATATGVLFVVLPSFVATVSTTTFTTGTGSANETIGTSSISYWSGPTTSTTGGQTAIPGQVNAAAMQSLSVPRTAFSSSGLVLTITTTWNPTIVIAIPPQAVAGTYTGTVTHSIA